MPFTCYGPRQGICWHKHRTIEHAQACLNANRRGVARYNRDFYENKVADRQIYTLTRDGFLLSDPEDPTSCVLDEGGQPLYVHVPRRDDQVEHGFAREGT